VECQNPRALTLHIKGDFDSKSFKHQVFLLKEFLYQRQNQGHIHTLDDKDEDVCISGSSKVDAFFAQLILWGPLPKPNNLLVFPITCHLLHQVHLFY
jgi:hypothetical protein